jgi:peptidoglycan/LPS O-acetylase OafA/YrhL
MAGLADASAIVRWGALVSYAVVLLGVAALTFLVVERPARQRIRRAIGARPGGFVGATRP